MKARGTIRVPGDKSISHRALILGALAPSDCRIRGILESDDVRSTATVLRALGAVVPTLSDDVVVRGHGLSGLTRSHSPLQCGNSGTTARLMAGVAAASPFISRFEGDSSLSRRPMARVAEPLSAMGAKFEFDRGDGLPMTVHGGRLSGIAWDTRAASAQTKSAILLAALVGGVHVSVRESRRSRDHTERLLRHLGVPVTSTDIRIQLSPVESLDAFDVTIPGDPSSAAYLLAYASLARVVVALPGVCVNPTRMGFIEALRRMGADIRYEDAAANAGEDVATIVSRPARLGGIRIGEAEVPSLIDELPLLACVAAAARVEVEVSGAAELRVKESDRIAAVVSNLRSVGADAVEMPDGFRVSVSSSRTLSGRIATRGDHRVAMAFGVLGALPGNEIEIDDRDCVSVSYPGFWEDLDSLRKN
ncbi:MAG: 3-phosphoshikimate 1-carboxyvinyltransferase [Gemmatimonadaceae bacterium]|nr:3-phosphoshikimate 1-carboxyvinyltransferase [Gemmatimonadaceae bacterium]